MFQLRTFAVISILTLFVAVPGANPPQERFELEEMTIAAMQEAMASGRYTSRRLTELYLQRIVELDGRGPMLRSISETNPDALAIAAALDAERKAKGPRGRCTAFRSSSRTTSTPRTG